jgi:rRNA maturation RNase YbeY
MAGIRASPTVIVAEPAWRRAIPGAVALAGRALTAAHLGAPVIARSAAVPGLGPGKQSPSNCALRGGLLRSAHNDNDGGRLPAFIRDTPRPIVVLTTDRAVRRLNARDRGRDKPTNVLTYPPSAPGLPGEIILALGQIRREAAATARRPAHHLVHLIVHGALHLAGHDHHHAGEARRMELAEARILHRLRVPNPWKRA